MVQKLIYLTNARLPTEKAHGYQVSKMCEALALNGSKVKLFHPYRYQSDPLLQRQTLFDYYSIRPIFETKRLFNLDVLLLYRFIPNRLFTSIFFTHDIIWGLYAVLIARKEKADIYYTRETSDAYWLVKLGLPTIFEAHLVPKRGRYWLLKRIAHNPKLKLVVVLTSFIKEELVRMGFPSEKVIILPDAVDLSMFENLPTKEECRKHLGIPTDRPIIGYIGRFQTMGMEKGIKELIQAMGQLPSFNNKESHLLCVGGPMDAVPAYLNLARQLGVPEHRLHFIDKVPNFKVPYWLRVCDVVTIPWPWTEFSAYFTSPMKLFEYMASGVPIVASDLPSIREVLLHGDNAWLVKPGDAKKIAEGIVRILQDDALAKRISNQARQEVTKYTWKNRASTILQWLSKDFLK